MAVNVEDNILTDYLLIILDNHAMVPTYMHCDIIITFIVPVVIGNISLKQGAYRATYNLSPIYIDLIMMLSPWQ